MFRVANILKKQEKVKNNNYDFNSQKPDSADSFNALVI